MGASVVARLGGLRAGAIVLAVLAACLDASAVPGRTPAVVAPGLQRGNQAGRTQSRPPDFEGMARQQAETDQTWRAASAGFMELEKITYRSSLDDLKIPAFLFQPNSGPTTAKVRVSSSKPGERPSCIRVSGRCAENPHFASQARSAALLSAKST